VIFWPAAWVRPSAHQAYGAGDIDNAFRILINQIGKQENFMANIDYNSLKINFKEITSKIYNNYIKEHGIKNLCGFALYSDEDAMSLSIAVNTYEHHKNNMEDDPENKLYYKFNPEEWDEIIENKELDILNEQLQEICLKIKRRQLLEHRNNIYKLSVELLEELKTEQLFKDLNNDFVLLFSISDCDLPEMVIEYNKKYNSKEIVNEYEQWLLEESKYEEEDDDEY
jgi:hypothetical protein